MTSRSKLLGLVAFTVLQGCHWFRQPAEAADSTGIEGDTARGIIRVVGSLPLSELVLVRTGRPQLSITGTHAELLKGLEGVEVALTGKVTGESATASPAGTASFAAERFQVRAIDGIPARDGVLESANSTYALRLASGERLPIKHLPPSLRGMAGARIYIAGDLNEAPAAYGIISRAP